MTRINCIPPSELVDKHLVAEYRELPRIFALAKHVADAPDRYVLGTGHMKFFYNKLKWLTDRHGELVKEMRKRGFVVNYPEAPVNPDKTLYGDWKPTPAARKLNRIRIANRLANKKGDVYAI